MSWLTLNGWRPAVVALVASWMAAPASAQIAVKTHMQILESFAVITGVPANDPEVQATYLASRSRMPRNGEIEEISTPMLLAVTGLAGIFCKKMIAADSVRA